MSYRYIMIRNQSQIQFINLLGKSEKISWCVIFNLTMLGSGTIHGKMLLALNKMIGCFS